MVQGKGIEPRHLRLVLVILFGACCLGSLASGASANRSGYAITLVTKALDSEFWAQVKLGAEEAARQHTDIQLSVLAPARELDDDQQVDILESQIRKRVYGLAVVHG